MAPVATFVQLTKKTALQCRVFINRKEVLKSLKQNVLFETVISSAQTTNHKALVRLRSSSLIYLSNSQLKSLMSSLKPHFVNIFLLSTPESLRLISNNKFKDELIITVEADGWKVRIITHMDFVMALRTTSVDDGDAPSLIIRKPKSMTQKEAIILFEEEAVEIPNESEPIAQEYDTKMIQKYTYKRINTPEKGIKIEVLKVPK